MNTPDVLVTGDYRHPDFADLILKASFPVRLFPLEALLQHKQSVAGCRLMIIAQSRRGQFPNVDVEELIERNPGTPVVGLCGTWCEGELRSGRPLDGMVRVYWHQWLGRVECFLERMQREGITAWHLPRICSAADRVIADIPVRGSFEVGFTVGISSIRRSEYLMLEDTCRQFAINSVWVEHFSRADDTSARLNALLVVSNSWDQYVQRRVKILQKSFPMVPMAATLNFPRPRDVMAARRIGVNQLLSRPFQLRDFFFTLQRLTAAA